MSDAVTQGMPGPAPAARDARAERGAIDTYRAELFGGEVVARPMRADDDGQRVWRVSAQLPDGRHASVDVRLTGQFGPEQLTPGSYTKEALADRLGLSTPGARARGDAEVFRGELRGADVVAIPSAAGTGNQRTWEVTVQEPDGTSITTTTRLAGQFGPADIDPERSELGRELSERLDRANRDQLLGAVGDTTRSIFPHFFMIGHEVTDQFQYFLDPLSGDVMRFQTHGSAGFEIAGRDARVLETTHYRPLSEDPNEVTRREKGIGISAQVPEGPFEGFRVSVNVRGGDMNLRSIRDGATATVTFEGTPETLKRLSEKLSDAKTQWQRRLAIVLGGASAVGREADLTLGVAYQASVQWDAAKQKTVLEFGSLDLELPLENLMASVDELRREVPPTNQGEAEIARANNFEAYRRGENPYAQAFATREDGAFRNHGDPVADIAGRLMRIHEAVGLEPVDAARDDQGDGRAGQHIVTNREAADGLVRAIRMYENAPVDPAYARLISGDQAAPDEPRLTPDQARLLESTATMLHEYGIAGLFGKEVADFASAVARADIRDVPVQEQNTEFVQKVFEGHFRRDRIEHDTLLTRTADILSNVHQLSAIAWGMLKAQPTANDTLALAKHRAALEGLEQRLDSLHGGVLDALGIDPGVASTAREREHLADVALTELHGRLVAERGPMANAESLYQAYEGMSPGERERIGQAAVERFHRSRDGAPAPGR